MPDKELTGQIYELDAITVTSIFQIRKLRHKEVK